MKRSLDGRKSFTLWYIAGAALLVILWEIFARLTESILIFPGPIPVAEKLIAIIKTERFMPALLSSFVRVLAGLLISAPLGFIAGAVSGLDKRIGALLRPFFSLTAAAPVMSVILIAFLIFGAENTPVFTAFLMVFPVTASAALEGIQSVNPLLKEMFVSYKMTRLETLRYLYIPSIVPFVLGAIRSSLSLGWKVIIASEVLVQPALSLGAMMQSARARLETPELYAWTAAAVIAAAITDALLSLAIYLFFEKKTPGNIFHRMKE